jgi:dUTP pyrophosphatase
MHVKIKRLRDGAVLPQYMTAAAVGLDLCALLEVPETEILIAPGKRKLVGTGVAFELPVGFEGQVRPRSGLALRHGITVLNAPGTIDPDFRGEVKVLLVNHGDEPFVIRSGDRIAQLVIAPVVRVDLVEVDTLTSSARGEGGYGHTGTQ